VQGEMEINLKELNHCESTGSHFWYIRNSRMMWDISRI